MINEYLSAIIISIFIITIAGLAAYTGQGFLIFWVVGTIIMHFTFRSLYMKACSRHEISLPYCYQNGWCAEINLDDIIMSAVVLLIFSFAGATGRDFQVPMIAIVLGAEYFIFRRYYRKKAKKELEERAKYKFDTLVKKIYDRDFSLGACFERNITFESFENNILTWASQADEYDKKRLIAQWGLINMFAKDIFGSETKIVNIGKQTN